MSTIRFEIQKEKVDKKGKAPVRLIYQISGQRKCINTDIKTFPACWNTKEQQVVYLDRKTAKSILPGIDYDLLPSDKQAKEMNADLEKLNNNIKEIEKRFELDQVTYNTEMVFDKLQELNKPKTKKNSPSKFLFDFIDQYIQDHEATRVKGSLVVYKSLKRHLQDFQAYKKQSISFETIDTAFFQRFETFLIKGEGTTVDKKGNTVDRKPVNNITAAKQLSTIKTFLNYARDNKIVVPEIRFKIKKDNLLEVIALTGEELNTLYHLDLTGNKAQAQVRDVFCFSCFTGLRYSDLKQLRREHIKEDGIELTTIKTTHKSKIPLTQFSRAVLDKYKEHYKPLPVISNQKSNLTLAKICKLAEINTPIEIVRKYGAERVVNVYPKHELVRMHCGRKTFVTLSLERGIPAEVVMMVSGHSDHKSFSRYVKVTEERKRLAMLEAWGGSLISPKLKAV